MAQMVQNAFASSRPSEKDLTLGRAERKGFREQVLADRKLLNDATPIFTQLRIESQTKAAKEIVENQLAWLNANINVTRSNIEAQKIPYTEKLQAAIEEIGKGSIQNISSLDKNAISTIVNSFPYSQYKPQLTKAANVQLEKQEKEKQIKDDETRNRTSGDNIISGIKTGIFYGCIAFFIIFSFRAAGFNANANLWRPLSFRILNFWYTFLFGIFWVPYYLVWDIKMIFDRLLKVNNPTKRPVWHSLFPMTPFTPSPQEFDPDTKEPLPSKDDFNFNKLLFGYPDTPDVKEWIQCQCTKWKELQECALK
jgi:hypothetical protein